MARRLTLEEIPTGKRVFVDAAVFIYHFAGASPDCRRFLDRCEKRDLKAITSTAALAEVTHRLMMMEAVQRGLVSSGNVARKLRDKPSIIKRLRTYQVNAEKIPLMGVDIRPLDLKVLMEAAELRPRYGLMTNDSIMAATALGADVALMATPGRDFERVRELTVAVPSDLTPAPDEATDDDRRRRPPRHD